MSAWLLVLGSGTALQTAYRDNTALAFSLGGQVVLVDCPGSPIQKLQRVGLDPMAVGAVVITHAHPDHLYGLPSLLHNLLLLERSTPLTLFAPDAELRRIHRLVDLFDLDGCAGFLDVQPIADGGLRPLWEYAGHRLYVMPVDHGPPAFAVRWDLPGGGRVIYSSDTRPVESLADFGRGSALFVHEATFAEDDALRARRDGHSTPAQAGRLATLAGAERLLLVHTTAGPDATQWIAEARTTFAGFIEVPTDGSSYELA